MLSHDAVRTSLLSICALLLSCSFSLRCCMCAVSAFGVDLHPVWHTAVLPLTMLRSRLDVPQTVCSGQEFQGLAVSFADQANSFPVIDRSTLRRVA